MADKGIVFSLDMVFSLLVFTGILIVLVWLWGVARSDIHDYVFRAERREKALRTSELLISSPGSPVYWHLFNVTGDLRSLGLAHEDHVLNADKIEAFCEANYSVVKILLGLTREDINFTVTRGYGSSPEVLYSCGAFINTSESVVVRRVAMLNGSDVETKLVMGYEP